MACRGLWAPVPALYKITNHRSKKILPQLMWPVLTYRKILTCTCTCIHYKPVTGTATHMNKETPQHATAML